MKNIKSIYLKSKAICLIGLLFLYIVSSRYNDYGVWSKYAMSSEFVMLIYIVVIYWCVLIKRNALFAFTFVNILFFLIFIFGTMDESLCNAVFICALLALLYLKEYCKISQDDDYVFSAIKVEILVFILLNEIRFDLPIDTKQLSSNFLQQPLVIICVVLIVYFGVTTVKTACVAYKSNKTRKQKRSKRLKQHVSLLIKIITNDRVFMFTLCGIRCFQQILHYNWISWSSFEITTVFFASLASYNSINIAKYKVSIDAVLEKFKYEGAKSSVKNNQYWLMPPK